MSLKNMLCLSVGVRIFIVVVGMGLVFFRCIKSANQAVEVINIPMLEAAASGQYDRMQKLLHDGESPNVADGDGNSALNFAVWNGIYPANRQCIELLLQHQAHTRLRNAAGQDSLHQVIKLDYKDLRMQILGKLIKFGGNINDKDLKSFTVLEKIVETYDTISVDMMLDWWGKLINDEVLYAAKKRAEGYNLADVLVVLNKKRERRPVQNEFWDPSRIDVRTGMSDLHYAVINNDQKLVDACLLRRASINQASKDEYGMRPLHYAVLHQYPDMVEHLLEKKADSLGSNMHGNTPLHMIAWIDDQDKAQKIADIMLKNNAATLRAKNKEGNTLLHLLIYNDNKSLIEYIGKRYEFDWYTKNNDRESGLSLAERLGRKYLVTFVK